MEKGIVERRGREGQWATEGDPLPTKPKTYRNKVFGEAFVLLLKVVMTKEPLTIKIPILTAYIMLHAKLRQWDMNTCA